MSSRRRKPVQACTPINDNASTDATMKSSSAPIAQSEMSTPPMHTKPTRRRTTPIIPQPGSLYDILHDNAGLPLFVRPLCWTDHHAKLLGCRFVRLPPHDTPTPPSSCPSSSSPSPQTPPSSLAPLRRPARSIAAISRGLMLLMSADKPDSAKTTTLVNILSTFYPKALSYPRQYSDLDLRFGSRSHPRAVRCQLLWNPIHQNTSQLSNGSQMSFDSSTTCTTNQAPSQMGVSTAAATSNEPPILAYISRSHLDQTRRTGFHIMSGPRGIPNHAVHRLHALRSKLLIPKNVDEDSYFVAVMVAIAQQSVYPDIRSSEGFMPRDVKVRVLTAAEEEDALIVYSATVPAALLSMFHEPDAAPTGNWKIKIEYAQVPAWPVLGLNERLGKALGSDIVGDFDTTLLNTLEDEEEELQPWKTSSPLFKSDSPKRKRGVFSEVVNTSFSEDRESDRLKDMFQKRRRIEKTSDAPSGSRPSKKGSRARVRQETGIIGVVQ